MYSGGRGVRAFFWEKRAVQSRLPRDAAGRGDLCCFRVPLGRRAPPFPGRPASLDALCAKRTAKARQTDRENERAHFHGRLPGFFMPGNSLGAIGQTGALCLFCDPELVRQNGSRAQAGPGEELSNIPLAALNFLFPSWFLKDYHLWA